MKARYRGEHPADLPTLGLHVEPGDVVVVRDDFSHPHFEPVGESRQGPPAVDSAGEGDA